MEVRRPRRAAANVVSARSDGNGMWSPERGTSDRTGGAIAGAAMRCGRQAARHRFPKRGLTSGKSARQGPGGVEGLNGGLPSERREARHADGKELDAARLA